MKTRIVSTVLALAALCLTAKFGLAPFRERAQGRADAGQFQLANSGGGRKVRRHPGDWAADVRTALAAIRYLFSPVPPETGTGAAMVASNSRRNTGASPDDANFWTTTATGTNQAAWLDAFGTASFTNQLTLASISTPDARAVDSRGDGFEQWLRLDIQRSYTLFKARSAVATNSHNASNAPSANFKYGLSDSNVGPG
jgi:hypothetical protein